MVSIKRQTSLGGPGLISGVNIKTDLPAGTCLIRVLNQKAD